MRGAPRGPQVLSPAEIFYARPSASVGHFVAALGRAADAVAAQAAGGLGHPGDSGEPAWRGAGDGDWRWGLELPGGDLQCCCPVCPCCYTASVWTLPYFPPSLLPLASSLFSPPSLPDLPPAPPRRPTSSRLLPPPPPTHTRTGLSSLRSSVRELGVLVAVAVAAAVGRRDLLAGSPLHLAAHEVAARLGGPDWLSGADTRAALGKLAVVRGSCGFPQGGKG